MQQKSKKKIIKDEAYFRDLKNILKEWADSNWKLITEMKNLEAIITKCITMINEGLIKKEKKIKRKSK